MPDLQDKVCLVTGGASGLGLAIVERLLGQGARVAVFDLNPEHLESLRKQVSLQAYKCDVTSEEQIQANLARLMETHERIDVLVNNVGLLYSAALVSFGAGGIKKHDSAMWEKVLSANLSSAFYTSKHVLEKMLEKRTRGVIVNISSVSARGNAGQSAYAAAKAGLEALTKVWAKELAPLGIRCFAVAPGFCDMPSTHAALSPKLLEETLLQVPLKRLGKPEEVAAMVLAGIENDYLTGKVLELDGGLVI